MCVAGNGAPYRCLGLLTKQCPHSMVCKVLRLGGPGRWWSPLNGQVLRSRAQVPGWWVWRLTSSTASSDYLSKRLNAEVTQPGPRLPSQEQSFSLCAPPHHASSALWPSWLLSILTLSHLALLTLPCCPEAHLFWFSRASLEKKKETKAVLPGKTSLHFCPNSLLLVQAIGMLLND